MDITLPALQKLEEKRGLAHSGFRDKGEKAAPRFNSIEQRSQRFAMAGTEIKEARIRCYTERLYSQFIEIKKHGIHPIFFGIAATTGVPKKDSTSSGVRNDGSQR